MTEYRLHALMQIRKRTKESAELNLRAAISTELLEHKKLLQLEQRLEETIFARTQRHNNFFQKALVNPSGKTEIVCHVLSHQKKMIDEIELKRMLTEQQMELARASQKVKLAKHAAIDAERNLKVVEKHHGSWQRAQLRAEEIKEEYAMDDQNGIRFIIKKA